MRHHHARQLFNPRASGAPWRLLWLVPWLLVTAGHDLLHSRSCPEMWMLHWAAETTHHHDVAPPAQDLGDDDDCLASEWAGQDCAASSAAMPALAFHVTRVSAPAQPFAITLPRPCTWNVRGPPLW